MIPTLLLLVAGCDEPCEAYAEDAFWTDMEEAYCARADRCGFRASCAETRTSLAYQREELAECGATFHPCVAAALVDAASESCESPAGPALYGDVYTPECPRDTGR